MELQQLQNVFITNNTKLDLFFVHILSVSLAMTIQYDLVSEVNLHK